jgi:hypothetical protein
MSFFSFIRTYMFRPFHSTIIMVLDIKEDISTQLMFFDIQHHNFQNCITHCKTISFTDAIHYNLLYISAH